MLDSLLDRLETLIATHVLAAEKRLFAGIKRQLRSELNLFRRNFMSAQSDAFKSALDTLVSRISTLQTDMQAKIDAAVSAQKAKDDAQSAEDRAAADASFKDATDALSALVASLPEHAEAVKQAGDAASASPTDASQAPASGDQTGSAGTGASEASAGATDAPAGTQASSQG